RNAGALGDLAPTQAVADVQARYPGASFTTAVDLRYAELFTNAFSTHRHSTVSPSLWTSYKLDVGHTLRLLAGLDLRRPEADFGAASYTPKLSLRDQIRLGRVLCVTDLSGRVSRAVGSSAGSAMRTD